ncbi:hypothetical protein C8R34_11652 [Nitrosomonas sp. Nm84]|nr:hypothetical protein C8R34_11652 [Nitrosomonas sp. Nm84]
MGTLSQQFPFLLIELRSHTQPVCSEYVAAILTLPLNITSIVTSDNPSHGMQSLSFTQRLLGLRIILGGVSNPSRGSFLADITYHSTRLWVLIHVFTCTILPKNILFINLII